MFAIKVIYIFSFNSTILFVVSSSFFMRINLIVKDLKDLFVHSFQSNSSTTMEVNTSFPNGNFQTVANRSECPVSCEMQTLQQPISSPRFSQTSLQNSQTMQGSPQISRHTDSQSHTPLHSNRTSISTVEQQHDHKVCMNLCSHINCCIS